MISTRKVALVCGVLFLGLLVVYHKTSTARFISALDTWNKIKIEKEHHLSALDIWNRNRIAYDPTIRAEFERLIKLQPASDNEDLVRMVKTLLDPPSTHPIRKTVHGIFQTPQAKKVDQLYKGQKGLFFVEAGGLDGERSSNTLWLEEKKGWSGLLVEVDPFLYTQLRGKARRSHSLNACLSGKLDTMAFDECGGQNSGCGRLQQASGPGKLAQGVPCFSLETVLLALNRSTIDYFSLDVEGHERQILDTIPWSRINIKVINIEFPHDDREKFIVELKAFMKERGYKDVARFEEVIAARNLYNRDIMFVKEGVELSKQ